MGASHEPDPAADLAASMPPAVPIDLPRVDVVRANRRARQTAIAITRRLGPLLGTRVRAGSVSDRQLARAFRRLTDDLGGSYTKFGQFVASAGGIFGEEVAAEFRTCLDAGPPVPYPRVAAVVRRQLGRPVEEVFPTFDREPLGSASIAVVHRAVTADGREVAVKILRPGVRSTVATDLVLMRQLFAAIGRVASPELGVGLRQGLDNFEAQVREELDLRNEREAMVHQRALLASLGLDHVVVPEPYPELSSDRILTMAFLDGVPVHDTEGLAELTDDPASLVRDVVQAWFVTALRFGTFHGDVHAGNLLVLRPREGDPGRVAMIDWGIVGRLDEDAHRFFRQLIAGALGDAEALDAIADEFFRHTGPVLTDRLGIPEDVAKTIIKARVQEVFTRPFGEIGFGQFLLSQQQGGLGGAGDLLGDALRDAGIADEDRDSEIRRRLRRRSAGTPPAPPEVDRNLFLLGKQLMFFESYGKTYLADEPFLHDPDFFARVLAER